MLTPERHEKIVRLLKAGNFLETAAPAAGVSSKSVRRWIRRGETGEEPYATFSQDVRQAIAESEARDVTLLAKAASEGDIRALTWRLERRHRNRWGAQITLVTEVREEAVGEILGRLRERLDPDTFRAVLVALRDPEDSGQGAGDSVH